MNLKGCPARPNVGCISRRRRRTERQYVPVSGTAIASLDYRPRHIGPWSLYTGHVLDISGPDGAETRAGV